MIAQKSIVRYNQNLKTWQVINGKVSDFGSGKHNKRRALRYALKLDNPSLYKVLVHFWTIFGTDDNEDDLMDRLLKAASLLCKGKVFDNGRVASQSEADKTYDVTYHDHGYHCTCPDFENGLMRQVGMDDIKWGGVILRGGELHCKHSLAVELAKRAGVELPAEPTPF